MDKISKLRDKINVIDEKILFLLNERAKIVEQIGKIKLKKLSYTYSPEREKIIINRLKSINKGPLKNDDVEEIFTSIINSCRSLQKQISVAYLGPEATFTHLAAIKIFGPNTNFVSKETISDIFYEVEKKEVDYGVVAVENTTEGIVTHTLDMFLECNLYICGELNMEIQHYLLSKEKSIDKVKTIYSHPQAIAQCKNFLNTKLLSHRRIKIVEVSSTAEAAKIVSRKQNSAAIASEIAAKVYNLNILAKNIQDIGENYTRFIMIGRHLVEPSGNDKTSILFSVKDRVGILHDVLSSFKKQNINLTMIESRPSKQRPWDYVFFIDFVGHIKQKHVQKAIKELKEQCVFYKFLGSYPQAK